MDTERDSVEPGTIAHLTTLYETHHRAASPMQRVANRITAALARPVALTAIMLLIIAWMVGNVVAKASGSTALEEFPFPDLDFIVTVTALLVALLILTTQRHEDTLAERRAQLTLQIAAVSEQKIAKVIALLEEQRRDNPLLASRPDSEATEMSHSADPVTTLQEVDQVSPTHQR